MKYKKKYYIENEKKNNLEKCLDLIVEYLKILRSF